MGRLLVEPDAVPAVAVLVEPLAVVGGEGDGRPLLQALRLQTVEQVAEGGVALVDLGGVGRADEGHLVGREARLEHERVHVAPPRHHRREGTDASARAAGA